MRNTSIVLHVLAFVVLPNFCYGSLATADPITFGFTGTVTGITDKTLAPSLDAGSIFSGSYTFEETAPDIRPGTIQGEYAFGIPFTLSVNVECATSTQTLSKIIIFDDLSGGTGLPFIDRYFVRSDGVDSSEFGELTVDMIGLLPLPLVIGDDLPNTPPDLGLVTESPNFQFFTAGLGIVGNLNALASVPEPATLALFGIGLVGLGYIRMRRRG